MYLGIDLGTSSLKALLVDDQQKIVASASANLEVDRPHSGWSEQNPAHWITALDEVMTSLKSSNAIELSAVIGIGLSGQMHGVTLLDENNKVLRPCMLWNDTRAHKEAQELDQHELFRPLTGNIVFPGFSAPKVKWVENHERETFEKIAKILLPKDYLRLWLTGDFVSEMSDASGTSWLDVAKRDWSQELLAVSNLDRSHMPRLVEGSEPSAQLRQELAAKWSMRKSVIVAGGAGDNAAAAIGMGAIKNGDAFVSLGTSGVVFTATDKFLPDPDSAIHAFCHALPNLWHQMGVILSATDALNWYAGIANTSAEELTNSLGTQISKPSGIIFLPYLSGERTPHNDANIRGAFVGIDHNCDQATLTRAVLEGVSFALKDNLIALQSAGAQLQSITAVGGGSKSKYWLRMIATILNIPVKIPSDGEFGAAFGAARLAILATNDGSVEEICIPPQIVETLDPQHDLVSNYEEAFSRFQSLYPRLKGI